MTATCNWTIHPYRTAPNTQVKNDRSLELGVIWFKYVILHMRKLRPGSKMKALAQER